MDSRKATAQRSTESFLLSRMGSIFLIGIIIFVPGRQDQLQQVSGRSTLKTERICHASLFTLCRVFFFPPQPRLAEVGDNRDKTPSSWLLAGSKNPNIPPQTAIEEEKLNLPSHAVGKLE
uniref:Uncharacterized protein n=1 Tax=Anopheles culicifacies TaxID=139723 RepID=A0A182MHN4_9DIPT